MRRAIRTRVDKAIARRSRREIEIGRLLRPGQRWRCRADQTIWTVRSVHRMDCLVVLIQGDTGVRLVGFTELRASWAWILEVPS